MLKKLSPSLKYLEEVRKHVARLPSIDPWSRTILLTGFPNVGKSSLINNLTNANVEVEPYAFTTQNIFVGHMSYKYAQWQVIDTPGLLHHNFQQRNTIEMLAITALAHLNSIVLFIFDLSIYANNIESEQAQGQELEEEEEKQISTIANTIEDQIGLFHSVKGLFKNKPIIFVLAKSDLCKWENVDEEVRTQIQELAHECKAPLLPMSNITGEGISQLKAQVN
jgi:nucleolar GTP-binding protein